MERAQACDIIDRRATDIYTACSFQDLTGQRTQKVIQVLRYLEERLASMLAIWSSAPAVPVVPPPSAAVEQLAKGSALPDNGLVQGEVDAVLAKQEPAAETISQTGQARPAALLPSKPPRPEPATAEGASPNLPSAAKTSELPPPLPIETLLRRPCRSRTLLRRPAYRERGFPVLAPAGLCRARACATARKCCRHPFVALLARHPVEPADRPVLGMVPGRENPPAKREDFARSEPRRAAVPPVPSREPAELPREVRPTRPLTLADIESLTFEEKAALFS